jgi:N-acetylmuramoyl-L-alanine amidase
VLALRGAGWPTVLVVLCAVAGCGGEGRTQSTASSTAVANASALATTSSSATTSATTTAPRSTTRRDRRPRRPAARAAAAVRPPPIVAEAIPFGSQRLAEMQAYAERHYGLNTYRLVHPRVIVIHFTDTPDFRSTYNTFAPDVPDVELHELPGVCSHFVIDRDGTIYQLVPLEIMCRHTVGLNWTAIGIEHVGSSDAEVMGDSHEFDAGLALVRWLRCRYDIRVANVIGHNESLSSPYHRENVAALRTQTHDDFRRADMDVYRARLRALGGCPA